MGITCSAESKKKEKDFDVNVIWVDPNIENYENKEYTRKLKKLNAFNIILFEKVNEAINHLKTINFKETKMILSGKLYYDFVESFKENILDMKIAPKIIIFTKNKEKFLENNKDYQNDTDLFYKYGGVERNFKDIKKFLKNKNDIIPEKEIKQNIVVKSNEVQLTFEYIDCKEKLILPLFFKTLIDNVSNENMEKYTSELYKEYSNNNIKIKKLLGSIESIPNIPIEILSKYYARLFTANSDFHKDLNKDLGLNKKDKYLPYIKTLYEGVKLKALPLANNNILYRGSKITNDEIFKIKNYLTKKIKDLPSSIVFSRTFLSFSKDRNIAQKFIESKNTDNNLSKVLFILEKNNNLGFDLSTHGDIEKISFFPKEKEVLFFQFNILMGK